MKIQWKGKAAEARAGLDSHAENDLKGEELRCHNSLVYVLAYIRLGFKVVRV